MLYNIKPLHLHCVFHGIRFKVNYKGRVVRLALCNFYDMMLIVISELAWETVM